MSEIERQYEYRPKLGIILLASALFGFGVFHFYEEARTNDRGLILNGIIHFSPGGATVFYWLMCFFSACFVAMAIAVVFHRFKYRQRIAFTPSAILMPGSRWSTEEKSIPYRDISALYLRELNGQRLLELTYRGGKSNILASMLPSRSAFEEVRTLLEERVRSAAGSR